jgi:iron-sulfur cluster repair protein YtfE (RIC family)
MAHACRCGCGHGDQATVLGAKLGRYTGDERVGDVAREVSALAVLERFAVNHCCGAHLSLREGAAAAGVELPRLLLALEEAVGQRAS